MCNKSAMFATLPRFFLYGFMAELFGLENGFARGLGNSMHVFFTPFGITRTTRLSAAPRYFGGAALLRKSI
jgi:2-oxoisovalerate dehydrogenase E1 component